MGKIRPKFVKRLARQLLESYPEEFGLDFQQNKLAVQQLAGISTKRARNMVAGYVTRLIKIKSRQLEHEAQV